jgi:signal transduction histidine kinase
MLWGDLNILVSISALAIGFIVISLLKSEHNLSPSYIALYIVQTVANVMALFVFLLRYIDFVALHFPSDKSLMYMTTLFPNHTSISFLLLVLSFIITSIVGIIYYSIRSTEKQTIGNLFYSNKTPIAILSDIDLFDSNAAFRAILDEVPLNELRTKHKITVKGRNYLIKHYPHGSIFKNPRDMTMVLLDISEQELTLHRLNLLDRRMSMISMLLRNKFTLLERLLALKSKNIIAIQLHDEIGHNLTLSVSVLDRMMDENLRSEIPRHSIESLLSEGKQIALSLSNDHKNVVSGKYLKEILESYILYLKWVGIHVVLNIDTKQIELNQQSILILYAICKEAFSNTVKYANASEIQVLLQIKEDGDEPMLELHIRDNGVGCGFVKESNGIKAIRSRVERYQGVFAYDGTEGFQIHCYLPLQRMTEVVS